MGLSEQSLAASVQRKHEDVFGRDDETDEDYLDNHIFQCNMVLYAGGKTATTGSVPTLLL
jgi:hypothetical protein